MGVLLGACGAPDPKELAIMESVLAHRGGPRPIRALRPHGSLVMVPGPEAGLSDSSDLAERGPYALGFVGHLTAGLPAAPDDRRPPAERLLDRVASEGPEVLEALRGAFIAALFVGEELHLIRDGAGVRTVYWTRQGGRFRFAIEPKGLWSSPHFARRLHMPALARYLSFSFQPGEETLLQDLYELPPGSRLHVDAEGQVKLHRWFRFEEGIDEEARDEEPEERWIERFRDEFGAAVRERMPPPEQPVAVTLSGGIDSSIVAAEVAASRPPSQVRTVAIHFGPKYPDELAFARAVAERLGTDHEEVLIRPKGFEGRLREIIWHLDDPIGDPVTVPNFEIARHLARTHTFVFNGEGGDPLFGGPKNVPMMMAHWYGGLQRPPGWLERAYLSSYRRAYEEIPALLSPEAAAAIDTERDLEAVLTPFFTAERPRRMLDKLQALNLRLKGAHLILPKVDRMQGAAGIVPLAPLFDERLITSSFRMPPKLKLDRAIEKGVLKRAYADCIPPEVIARPKSGMRVPVRYWFAKEMRRVARRLLSRKEVQRAGLFNPDRVQQLLDYDLGEPSGRYGIRLWMLITFELWRRIVIEDEGV